MRWLLFLPSSKVNRSARQNHMDLCYFLAKNGPKLNFVNSCTPAGAEGVGEIEAGIDARMHRA
jgi:hypothetical protein